MRVATTALILISILLFFLNLVHGKSATETTAFAATEGKTPSNDTPSVWPIITPGNAKHLELLLALPDPREWIWGMNFSNDGALLAASTWRGEIYIWKVATRQRLSVLTPEREDNPSCGVKFSPNGQLLVSSNGRNVLMWSIPDVLNGKKADAKVIHRNQIGSVCSVTFSTDGTKLAARDDSGVVRIWESKTGVELASWQDDVHSVGELLFSRDDSILVTAGYFSDSEGTVQLWNIKTQEKERVLSGSSPLALSRDGSKLAVSSGGKNPDVLLYDPKTGKQISRLHSPYQLYQIGSLTFHPDGTIIAAGSIYEGLVLWETNTRRPLTVLKPVGVKTMLFSPNGDQLATGHQANDPTDSVKLWGIKN
jgi:hypothetical protein